MLAEFSLVSQILVKIAKFHKNGALGGFYPQKALEYARFL